MKQLTNDQIYELYNEPRSDSEMVVFARAVIAEFCKINNLTGEAQPAREWVGLTEVETEALWKKHSFERWDHGGTEVMREGNFEDAARDLDSKLREKNAGQPATDDKAGGEPVADFQVVAESTGYRNPRDPSAGHGSAYFKGVRCPKCKHEFMPMFATETRCPECGYTHPHPQAIPPGYALVPVEPTLEMLDEAGKTVNLDFKWIAEIYHAMLAAAPKP